MAPSGKSGSVSPSQPQPIDSPRLDAAARYQRQLQAIMDVVWSVHSAPGIDALMVAVLDRVTELLGVERSTFFVVDRKSAELWSRVLQGDEPEEIRLPLGAGIAGWVAVEGESISLSDAYADPRFDRTWDAASGYRTRSLLCVPIRKQGGEVLAVLQCLNKRAGDFDDEDEELLSVIGAQCAVAMEKALLYESVLERKTALELAESRLRRAHDELAILYEVEQQIADAHDLERLVEVVVRHVCSLMRARAVGLLWLRNEGPVFMLARLGAEVVRQGLSRLDAEAYLRAHKLPARSTEAGEPPGLPQLSGLAPVELFEVPVSDGRRQIGVLHLVDPPDSADREDTILRQLAQIASQLGRGVVVHREREEGERAQRLALLGHSFSGLLHDMRTPMTAISGYVELLAMSDDQEARGDFVERIHRALGHIEGMTQEVLGFARGQRDVLIARVYLDRFIAEVRELLLPELEQSGATLAVDARYQGPARFDASKVKRVILNLARNACQAMGDGGTFLLRVDREEQHVVFECADTGPGIPPQMEGRLFDSFATHGKEHGTGLGLAMAKKTIDAHCGRITCENRPGRGATFRILLPL